REAWFATSTQVGPGRRRVRVHIDYGRTAISPCSVAKRNYAFHHHSPLGKYTDAVYLYSPVAREVAMNISSILIPRFPLWLLRIASAPESKAVLLHDAVAFASWYSPAHDLIDWPEEVRQIQAAQDEKKLTLEQTLKLLSGLGAGLSGKVSAARAKVMLEGY